MRTASYIGFFVMAAVAVAAFVLFDEWWLTAVGVLVALAIGWYSLGLYARATTTSAYRMIRGVASDEDYEEVGGLGESAAREAIRQAADAPDPQRDRIFGEFLNQVGGLDAAQALVVEHMAGHGFDVDSETAYDLLESWRKYGIVRDESLGEYLDDQANHLEELEPGEEPTVEQSTDPVRVFAVVDLRRGEAVEVFADRKDAAQFLDHLKTEDPKLAARLSIEERAT
jgi:hypothetical protein